MSQTGLAGQIQESAGIVNAAPAVDRIVESHGQLVESMARRVHTSLPESACIELKDLVQAGNVGLVNAARSYSESTGVPFEIYARFRIRGEILDMLRRLDAASRTLRNWQKKIHHTVLDLSVRLQREPTDEEISGQLGVALDRFRRKNLDIRTACAVSRSSQGGDQMEDVRLNQPGPRESRPDALQSDQERRKIVRFAVDQLPDRPRQIILMYYHQEYTMREIGQRLCMHESRVSQIHKGALQTILENLKMYGINSPADF
jgi:RNA polymerase sigma factor for flagellar operon FliA